MLNSQLYINQISESRQASVKRDSGFTLMEMTVVIFIISTLFFFAVPSFHNIFISDSKKLNNWISAKIISLKEKSVKDRQDYIMNIDFDSKNIWISNEYMTAKELDIAEKSGFKTPEHVRLLGLEYPDGTRITQGVGRIYFYKKGYSSKVFIHIADNLGQSRSFLVEPFITRIREYEGIETF